MSSKKKLMMELNRLNVEEFKAEAKVPIVLILDNIRSAMNVGSVFRTADAFRLEKIILVGISAQPPHKEINKTAIGASKTVDWVYVDKAKDIIAILKQQGYTIHAIEQVHGSITLNAFGVDKNTKLALIFGNEVSGVQDELIQLTDSCIEIPQFGSKHSLNIAVSVGIVVWDIFIKGNYLK